MALLYTKRNMVSELFVDLLVVILNRPNSSRGVCQTKLYCLFMNLSDEKHTSCEIKHAQLQGGSANQISLLFRD